ncbi:MAG: hypothetical protein AAGH72_13045 [Verrucomicrobiota bacterium]
MNKREKNLLIGFGILCLVVLLVVGALRLRDWNRHVKDEIRSLNDQIQTAEYWNGRQTELETRQAWIQEKLPLLTDRNESTSRLISLIQNTSRKHSLKTERQEVLEVEENAREIRVQLEASTNMQALARWLNDLQRPENMIAIPEIEIKPQSQNDNLKVILVVCQYFLPQTVNSEN